MNTISRITFVACCLVIISVLSAGAYDYTPEKFWGGFDMHYAYGEDFETPGIDVVLNRSFGDRVFEVRQSIFRFSTVKRDGHLRVSLSGPCNLALFGLGTLLGYDSTGFKSPISYLLLAPNSHYSLKVADELQLTVGMTSELIGYTYHGGQRGLLMLPTIGFTVARGSAIHRPSFISLVVNFGRFVDFDGPDSSDGWAVAVHIGGAGIND